MHRAGLSSLTNGQRRSAPGTGCCKRSRNLVYTAVTRARRLVVVIGQKRALSIAVKNTGDQRRWSKLRDRLAEH